METNLLEPKTTKPIEWLFNEKLRWVYHIIFWIFIYADELLSLIGITDDFGDKLHLFIQMSSDIVLVYIILYYLFPKFLLKGKVKKFFALLIISIGITVSIQTIFYEYLCSLPGEFDYPLTLVIGSIVATTMVAGFALGIKIFKNYILTEVQLRKLETDNLKTELTYLKDQINPHFLFNSLNNIYILNKKAPEQAGESILLLSDLLRYQLYDSANDKVNLADEITNLKNFLELDKLRKENLEIEFEVFGKLDQISISPYLFMPFIENSLKHTQSSDEEAGYLKISFDVSNKNEVTFKLRNSKPKNKLVTKVGGIGLVNVKRRLELVYPKKHNLQIDNAEKYYETVLKINIGE